MKKIIAFIVLISLFACKSTQKQLNELPISIESASYQNWYGGRSGVRGVKIEINGILNKQDLVFKSAYYLDKKSEIQTQIEDDKILLSISINTSKRREMMLSSNPNEEFGNKAPVKPKYADLKENEVVIEYLNNDKIQFIKVELKKKKDLFYP